MAWHSGTGAAGSKTQSPTLADLVCSSLEAVRVFTARVEAATLAGDAAQIQSQSAGLKTAQTNLAVYQSLAERLGGKVKVCRVLKQDWIAANSPRTQEVSL